MRIRLYVFPIVMSGLLALSTGCGVSSLETPTAHVPVDGMNGTVFGGQQAVSGATVKVWAVGTSGYGTGASVLATTTTDTSGSFSFGTYTCPYSNTPVYVTAQGGNPGAGANPNLMLAAGLGTCSAAKTQTVNINEVTTVATAYAMGQFFTTTMGSASTDGFGGTAPGSGVYSRGLVMANSATIPMLVNLPTGMVSASSSATTIEAAKIYTIANVLAACVNSTGQTSTTETTTNCGKLFNATKPVGGATRPSDTLQAAVQMSLYPYQNVSTLFGLTPPSPPFVGLATLPNDWTVGVSYTNTSLGLGVNGSGNIRTGVLIDVDASGKVWFPSTKTGASGVANFDPASMSFNGPYQGTNLTHPQTVQIDQSGIVWVGDMASNHFVGVNAVTPTTVTTLTAAGATGFGPFGVDFDNTMFLLFTTSGGTQFATLSTARSSVTANGATYGSGTQPFSAQAQSQVLWSGTNGASTICALEEASAGSTADVQYSPGSVSPCSSGGITQTINGDDFLAVAGTQYCGAQYGCANFPMPVSAPAGIVTDGTNHEWIANSGNASVSTMQGFDDANFSNNYPATSPVAYLHNSIYGGTMTTPYAITADGSGNLWVLNAGCLGTGCTPTSLVLSELIGAAGPTIAPLSLQQVGNYSVGVTDLQATRPTN